MMQMLYIINSLGSGKDVDSRQNTANQIDANLGSMYVNNYTHGFNFLF